MNHPISTAAHLATLDDQARADRIMKDATGGDHEVQRLRLELEEKTAELAAERARTKRIMTLEDHGGAELELVKLDARTLAQSILTMQAEFPTAPLNALSQAARRVLARYGDDAFDALFGPGGAR